MRADLVRDALCYDAIAAHATALAAAAREALTLAAVAEYTEHGAAPTWRTDLATVPLAVTKARVIVEDPKSFADWVFANYPDEVYLSVREAWSSAFRARIAERGDPPCDDDGQIVPGLRYVPGGQPRGVSIRANRGVRDALADVAAAMLSVSGPHMVAAVESGAWEEADGD